MAGSVPILMYHRISECPSSTTVPGHYVSPGLFDRQLKLLRRLRYTSQDLDTLFQTPLPERPIVITFDDGYENFHSHALARLKARGFSATVFVVANLIGQTNRWDSSQGDTVEPLMTIDQLIDCIREGMAIGSHTLDHADLNAVSPDEARRQIVDSRRLLSNVLGGEIPTFCYPYGRRSPEVEAMVGAAGYRLACSTLKGSNTETTNRFALRRINVRRDTRPAVLLYKLLRAGHRG